MTRVDLNCDLGEGVGDDLAILPYITSASVACGLHAGGPADMRRTVDEAARLGVAVGAHPGYPDRAGFGRHELALTPEEIHDLVLYQIGALSVFARRAGVPLQHVKAHGALYHVAAREPALAEAVAAAARAANPDLILVGPPSGHTRAAAHRHGLRYAAEIFADRNYDEQGALLPRIHPDALVAGDDAAVAARAVAMVMDRKVFTAAGGTLDFSGETLCLHGDDPRAAGRARAIRGALAQAGVTVAPLGSWL